MKTLPFLSSAAALAGLFVSVAAAQTSTASLSTPSTPAPAINVAAPAPTARPAADRIISAPRLPTAEELTRLAQAQGVSIEQIDQTANDVTITYRFADGRTSTVAYQLLPNGAAAATAPAAPAATTVVTGRTEPTVVYYSPEPQRVVYYGQPAAVYYDPFYYPWYGPVSVNLGFGFGYRGGHGHWGGRGHGGHHW